MIRQVILAGFVVIFPVGIRAQGRGAMVAVPRVAAVAPRVTVVPARTGTLQAMAVPRMLVRSGAPRPRTGTPVIRNTRRIGTRTNFGDNDFGRRSICNSAPGLGFDEVHLAAVCGPGTFGFRGNGLQVPFFFPFFDGGFSLPGTVAAVDETSALEGAQQDATEAEIRDLRRRYRALQAMNAPASAPAPVVEVVNGVPAENDAFVFVRRDGTVFFAVAYAWENGILRYVTSEGLRRTVTQDTLDLEATRQFNEQRGFNFRLPA
jgi:hypothetical protein